MKKLLIISMLVAVAAVAVLGVSMETAKAQPEYVTDFTYWFPWTTGTKLEDCITCHDAGATTLNPYGRDLEFWMLQGWSVLNGIQFTGSDDSDGDSFDNNTESIALTFPGDPTDYPLCEDSDSDGFFNLHINICGTTIDCNDNDPAMFPGNPEVCDDAKDNDCDGDIDAADSDCESWICAENDLDGDGFSTYGNWCGPVDCNDSDLTIFPGACDIKRDGIDQNCDGVDRKSGPPCK